jgi:hypothetical protein
MRKYGMPATDLHDFFWDEPRTAVDLLGKGKAAAR